MPTTAVESAAEVQRPGSRCSDVAATNGNGGARSGAGRHRTLTAVAGGSPPAVARVVGSLPRREIRIASTVQDVSGLADAAARMEADVALLASAVGGHMPSRRALDDLWRRLEELGFSLPVVAVIAESERRDARKLIEAGVAGLVLEGELAATLTATVRAVSSGQLVYPRELRTAAERPTLTHREKQVLGLVVMGCTNSEIAAKLWLAESTIKSHLSSAFGKLGVRSRAEAAARILDPGEGLGTGILAISGVEHPVRPGN
jgi:DNA-binding NarL/FixJ family response regulator